MAEYFAGLASRVPGVTFVTARLNGGVHIYTGLRRRSLRSCRLLYDMQDKVRDEFPGLHSDFHIIYAGDLPPEEFMSDAENSLFRWESPNIRNRNEENSASSLRDPSIGRIVQVITDVPEPIRADKLLPWLGPGGKSELSKE
jgi:hypothetical protein